MSQGARDKHVRQAERWVMEWVRAGVMITFQNEYREAHRGGTPLANWSASGPLH
jgi:hypothetical protein